MERTNGKIELTDEWRQRCSDNYYQEHDYQDDEPFRKFRGETYVNR